MAEERKEYWVEKDAPGCERCGGGATFAVVHLTESGEPMQESTTYEREEDAEGICEMLNYAFERGKAAAAKTPSN